MTALFLLLPFPPTTNNLFSNSKNGGRFISKPYKAWRVEAELALLRQNPIKKLDGDLCEIIRLGRPSKHRRDVWNYEKAINDSLTGVAYHDDSQIVDGRIMWDADTIGASVEIWQK